MNRHDRRAEHTRLVKAIRLDFRAWQVVMHGTGRPTSPDAYSKYLRELKAAEKKG